MRKTLTVLGVLLLVLLAVDRGGELVAERTAADQAQSRLDLDAAPDVEIDGFPFLTQLVARHFDQVHVGATDVALGRLRAGRVDVTATDLRVDPSMPLESRAARVRADVLLPYDELSRLAPERVTVGRASGGRLRVSAPLDIPGRSGEAVARSAVSLRGDTLVVRSERVAVDGTPLDEVGLSPRVRGRLDFSVPVDGLPGGLRLTGVTAGPDGLLVAGEGRGLALARVAAAWR